MSLFVGEADIVLVVDGESSLLEYSWPSTGSSEGVLLDWSPATETLGDGVKAPPVSGAAWLDPVVTSTSSGNELRSFEGDFRIPRFAAKEMDGGGVALIVEEAVGADTRVAACPLRRGFEAYMSMWWNSPWTLRPSELDVERGAGPCFPEEGRLGFVIGWWKEVFREKYGRRIF